MLMKYINVTTFFMMISILCWMHFINEDINELKINVLERVNYYEN